jgi:hypothetical protein
MLSSAKARPELSGYAIIQFNLTFLYQLSIIAEHLIMLFAYILLLRRNDHAAYCQKLVQGPEGASTTSPPPSR